MTDRELLELAARAVKVPAYWSVDGSIQNRPIFVTEAGGKMGTMPYESEWNPLKDDALALRMAVNLNLWVQINHLSVEAELWQDDCGETKTITQYLDPDSDRCAATRRAITRAAAEIGKQRNSHD
ncbi:MAG: hypothetical protein H5U29_00010 [Pusillimonas sp.]|nr:hypothetical protein [Pusillimonas sp.]